MADRKAVKVQRIKPKWQKPRSHEPNMDAAQGLQAELEKLESKYGVELTKVEPAGRDGLGQQTGDRANEYPIRLFQRDPYDNVVALKAAADEKVFGQKMLTANDLAYLRRKQEAVTAANYEIWLNSLFNMRDPAQAELRKKVDPEYYQKREMWIEERAELEKELAKLSLYGYPQNDRQTKLLFMLSTGQIRAPKGVLYDPRTWEDVPGSQELSADTFKRGLFNPASMKRGASDQQQMPFDYLASVVNRANYSSPAPQAEGRGREVTAFDVTDTSGRTFSTALGGFNRGGY